MVSQRPDIYTESVVFDALNVSNWDSQGVYDSLSAGQVTGINATIAIWENYRETMDNLAAWIHRFETQSETLSQAGSVPTYSRPRSGERRRSCLDGRTPHR